LAWSSDLEHEHPRALAHDEAVAVWSKGRRPSGLSRRSLIAVRRMNPVMPSGWIIECAPPASITSASPRG
jgi:hypothetical protein